MKQTIEEEISDLIENQQNRHGKCLPDWEIAAYVRSKLRELGEEIGKISVEVPALGYDSGYTHVPFIEEHREELDLAARKACGEGDTGA